MIEIAILKRASRPEARPFSCDSSSPGCPTSLSTSDQPRRRAEATLLAPSTIDAAIAYPERTTVSLAPSRAPRAGRRAFYRDRTRRPSEPSPPAPLGPPPGSTPIGPTGQRGFVQSGFNDVPAHAAPA